VGFNMTDQELMSIINDKNKSFEEKEAILSQEFDEAISGLSSII
jgi:hypothetical protein